jgi:hypothetical protein
MPCKSRRRNDSTQKARSVVKETRGRVVAEPRLAHKKVRGVQLSRQAARPVSRLSAPQNLASSSTTTAASVTPSNTASHPVSIVMSAPASRALRRCVCTANPSASYLRPTAAFAQQRIAQRWQSTGAAAAPTNPKIATIVDQISQLTLLETADLVSTLKVRFSECRQG